MFNFPKKKTEISTEVLVRFIWVSSFLAMIFTIPPSVNISRNLFSNGRTHNWRSHWFWSTFCHSGLFRKDFKKNHKDDELSIRSHVRENDVS